MNFLLKPITSKLKAEFPDLWVDRWHGQVGRRGYEYTLPACFVEVVRLRYEPGDRYGNRFTALIRFHVRQADVFESEVGGDLETESLESLDLAEAIELRFHNWEYPEVFRMERTAPGFSGNTPETENIIDFNVWGWKGSGLIVTTLKLSPQLLLELKNMAYEGEITNIETEARFQIATTNAWRVWVLIAVKQNERVHGVQAVVLQTETGVFEGAFTYEESGDALAATFEIETDGDKLMLKVLTQAEAIRHSTLHIL